MGSVTLWQGDFLSYVARLQQKVFDLNQSAGCCVQLRAKFLSKVKITEQKEEMEMVMKMVDHFTPTHHYISTQKNDKDVTIFLEWAENRKRIVE